MHKTTSEPQRGLSRRGCLILVAGVVAVVLTLDAIDPPKERQRSVPHYDNERYTAKAGATVCESLPDFQRIVELARADDTEAFNAFLLVSSCHVVQHPTEVVVEDHEQGNIIRVRAPGSITSWYMFEKGLQ